MTATRRLTAILAADVAGYSRLMGADEEGTLERLKALRRELVDPAPGYGYSQPPYYGYINEPVYYGPSYPPSSPHGTVQP